MASAENIAWCSEANARPIMVQTGRWYFAIKVDGREQIDCLQGTDGANVRKLLHGKLDDFAGWSEERMQGYRRWLFDCAAKGGAVVHGYREAA